MMVGLHAGSSATSRESNDWIARRNQYWIPSGFLCARYWAPQRKAALPGPISVSALLLARRPQAVWSCAERPTGFYSHSINLLTKFPLDENRDSSCRCNLRDASKDFEIYKVLKNIATTDVGRDVKNELGARIAYTPGGM